MTSRQIWISRRTAIGQAFRKLLFEEDGAAVVEATILAPILVAMGVYVADFGLLFYTKMQVQNAAQAGAQWAIANRVFNATYVQIAGTNATTLAGVSFTPSPSQFCGCSEDSSGNLAVTQLSAGACTTPAPGATCNTSGVAGNYVTVTATKSYNSLVPFGLITSNYTISSTTTARIQ
jgi:Flp pilus assembly protein TadG